MREMEVVGVRVELPNNQPIVLLSESDGERYLPIWIGSVEATAIAYEQQGVKPPRPLTHDLMINVIDALGSKLERVRITGMKDGLYFAELDLANAQPVTVRPSDGIALALRAGAPIFADDDLIETAGIAVEEASGKGGDEDSDDEVEKFREFLDNVTPEDFAGS